MNETKLVEKKNKLGAFVASAVGFGTSALATLSPVFAAKAAAGKNEDIVTSGDIFVNAGNMMNNLYGKIFGLTTMIAVLVATIALVMRMFSSNQKTVDTANAWLKRIIVCWILINSMTFIVNYLGGYFGQNGKFTWNGIGGDQVVSAKTS